MDRFVKPCQIVGTGDEEVFIACTENLTGIEAANHASFPQTENHNCMIQQLSNSSKYVSYKELQALMYEL